MGAKHYDPAQVKVTFGGHVVQGYADGTFVEVARNEQSFSLQVGTDGEGTRSKTNNKSGTVTLTLMQSSQSNDVLSGFSLADELSSAGVFPLSVVDKSGKTIVAAETAWIQKPADVEFSREATSRQWVFETDNLIMNIGGNNPI